MADIDGLTRALGKRFAEEEASDLARILVTAHDRQTISYEEIALPSELKDEMIMLLHRERLLVSMKSSSAGGSAWTDRVLNPEDGEKFQMPRVVRHLIDKAKETGEWDTDYAEGQCLNEAGEKRIREIVEFISMIKTVSPDCRVTPEIMREIAAELNMTLDFHKVIDVFVRCGIISPPIQASLRSGSVQYEINPSLYW